MVACAAPFFRGNPLPTFFEFFAGGGMVRAGLDGAWKCAFANDFDHKKSAAYKKNWGDKEIKTADVRTLSLADLPGITPDLIWASFPCQDLSLAGGGAGLKGNRSGTFWPFWGLVSDMCAADRAPAAIVLENVCGTLTSHEGNDFRAIIKAFADLDYDVGAVVIDAELFVPQSRPRLFFVGTRRKSERPFSLLRPDDDAWHPPALKRAYNALPPSLKQRWVWWTMPAPSARNAQLKDILEPDHFARWNDADETEQLLAMMSVTNRKKVDGAKATKARVVGAMYRRTRMNGDDRVQRVEVRFDGVAGCLRTPAGGSSRQSILVVDGKKVRSRLITARETARLMGLPEWYALPERYNEAYHLTGDGVVVPVVKHLSEHLLLPLTQKRTKRKAKAA